MNKMMCTVYAVSAGLIAVGELSVFAAVGSSASESIAQVRQALVAVVNGLPDRRCGRLDYLKEFGFRKRNTDEYATLARAVSNEYDVVFANFNACATNELQRLVLMSAGWAYDDDYYLRCYSNVLDLAENGLVAVSELRWYNEGSGNERRMNLLSLCYDAPGVSNLVLKLQAITGNTNYCQKVLSGESKQMYLQYRTEIECIAQ